MRTLTLLSTLLLLALPLRAQERSFLEDPAGLRPGQFALGVRGILGAFATSFGYGLRGSVGLAPRVQLDAWGERVSWDGRSEVRYDCDPASTEPCGDSTGLRQGNVRLRVHVAGERTGPRLALEALGGAMKTSFMVGSSTAARWRVQAHGGWQPLDNMLVWARVGAGAEPQAGAINPPVKVVGAFGIEGNMALGRGGAIVPSVQVEGWMPNGGGSLLMHFFVFALAFVH